jgi:hypothetical protein
MAEEELYEGKHSDAKERPDSSLDENSEGNRPLNSVDTASRSSQ